jgi:hypothetical protein
VSYFLAQLKDIIDFLELLIGAEGARLLQESRDMGDPTGAKRRGGSPPAPRKSEQPGEEINTPV